MKVIWNLLISQNCLIGRKFKLFELVRRFELFWIASVGKVELLHMTKVIWDHQEFRSSDKFAMSIFNDMTLWSMICFRLWHLGIIFSKIHSYQGNFRWVAVFRKDSKHHTKWPYSLPPHTNWFISNCNSLQSRLLMQQSISSALFRFIGFCPLIFFHISPVISPIGHFYCTNYIRTWQSVSAKEILTLIDIFSIYLNSRYWYFDISLIINWNENDRFCNIY